MHKLVIDPREEDFNDKPSGITMAAELNYNQIAEALTEYCQSNGFLPADSNWHVVSCKFDSDDNQDTDSAKITFGIGKLLSSAENEHDTVIDNEIPLCNTCEGTGFICEASPIDDEFFEVALELECPDCSKYR